MQPPAEELMEAADEYGMFIELEMPLCWDRSVGDDAFYYTIQVHSEAVHFNRHHPSVIAWSLANESPWTPTFTTSLNSVVKKIDSSRPFMFDGGSGQTMRVDGGQLDIETAHYPGLRYDFEHAPQDHPISFGEFGMFDPSCCRAYRQRAAHLPCGRLYVRSAPKLLQPPRAVDG